MTKPRPIRVRFTRDDPAALWREGDTADDLGPESPGSSAHVFRLDGFDDSLVVLEDPYGRGLVERLHPAEPGSEEPDIPFEELPEIDLADRCARCSHVAAQHMPRPGMPVPGPCGAENCDCGVFVA